MKSFPLSIEETLQKLTKEDKKKLLILRGLTFIAIIIFCVLFFTLDYFQNLDYGNRRTSRREESVIFGGVGFILYIYYLLEKRFVTQPEKRKYSVAIDELNKKLVLVSTEPQLYSNVELTPSEVKSIGGKNDTSIMDSKPLYHHNTLYIFFHDDTKKTYRLVPQLSPKELKKEFFPLITNFHSELLNLGFHMEENFLKSVVGRIKYHRIFLILWVVSLIALFLALGFGLMLIIK